MLGVDIKARPETAQVFTIGHVLCPTDKSRYLL